MDQQLPSAIEVTDEDGVVHWTSPYSELAKRLTQDKPEVTDEAEDDAPADDDDPGAADGQSSVGERDSRSSDR